MTKACEGPHRGCRPNGSDTCPCNMQINLLDVRPFIKAHCEFLTCAFESRHIWVQASSLNACLSATIFELKLVCTIVTYKL